MRAQVFGGTTFPPRDPSAGFFSREIEHIALTEHGHPGGPLGHRRVFLTLFGHGGDRTRQSSRRDPNGRSRSGGRACPNGRPSPRHARPDRTPRARRRRRSAPRSGAIWVRACGRSTTACRWSRWMRGSRRSSRSSTNRPPDASSPCGIAWRGSRRLAFIIAGIWTGWTGILDAERIGFPY